MQPYKAIGLEHPKGDEATARAYRLSTILIVGFFLIITSPAWSNYIANLFL